MCAKKKKLYAIKHLCKYGNLNENSTCKIFVEMKMAEEIKIVKSSETI